MSRVKRGVTAHRRHKKLLARTKGHHGQRHRVFRRASESALHAGRYSYADRRARKGDFRRLWITRINAASRQYDLSYSKLIDGMNKAGIEVDRKMLANLAVERPEAFEQIANQARAAL
ncbi:MAG: 50S ribosomal protein L20 [Dehalococcoidia bacterium]|nr:50S ribosomal protein L20 [Dehalococcoidia bacterium]